MYDAARRVNIHDFIESLPKGYDTQVGERGLVLSGGEKQLIALARAILKDAPILIWDEATSSLDSQTEAVLIEYLGSKECSKKTVIMIAHRLASIRNADIIYVMASADSPLDSSIQEQGTHLDLLSKENGIYKEMWKRHKP